MFEIFALLNDWRDIMRLCGTCTRLAMLAARRNFRIRAQCRAMQRVAFLTRDVRSFGLMELSVCGTALATRSTALALAGSDFFLECLRNCLVASGPRPGGRLATVTIASCRLLSPALPSEFGLCESLTALNLQGCGNLVDISVLATTRCGARLRSLDLRGTGVLNITGDLSALAAATSLTFLNISHAEADGELDLSPLRRLAALADLRVDESQVADYGPVAHAVRQLDLSGMSGVPGAMSEWLGTGTRRLRSLSALTRLDLSNCSELTHVSALAKSCPKLERLNVRGCKGLVGRRALTKLQLALPALRIRGLPVRRAAKKR